MAGRREFIYELAEKLDVLRRATVSRTWREVLEMTGIDRSVLGNVRDSEHEAYSKLSTDHQDMLASAFNFTRDMAEWRSDDRGERDTGPGPDTASAFRKTFLKQRRKNTNAVPKPGGGVRLDEGPTQKKQRVSEVHLTAGQRRPSYSPLGTMAQVALDEAQPAGAGAFQVLVDLSCHKGNIVGSSRRFSVRRALLTLDCGDARGRREAIAGINGLPVVLQNSYGETQFVWVGTQRLLRWEVAAGGAIIGHLLFDAGVVEELAPGDVLRVTLSAWLKHIDTDEIDQDPAFGIIDPNGALAQLPEDKLAIEQRRLIEHINKLKLKSDGNGQVEIASAEFQLERKP